MIVHYFNGKQMAYTLCLELPCGPLAVNHSTKHEDVTCPACELLQFDREHPIVAMGSREWTLRQKLMTSQEEYV